MQKKQAVPHVGWKLIGQKHYVVVFVVFNKLCCCCCQQGDVNRLIQFDLRIERYTTPAYQCVVS